MITLIRRIFHTLAYRLYARRKLQREETVTLMGLRLKVPAGVFHPTLFKSSEVIARYLTYLNLAGQEVLDFGCGSGVLALVMARSGARVTASDVNPEAVRATKENARANGLTVETHLSDLFGSMNPGRMFDLIVWNPPFYEGSPDSTKGLAWWAGEELGTIGAFAHSARSYLSAGGYLLLCVSTEMKLPLFRKIFAEAGWELKQVLSRRWLFEEFLIFEIRPLS